MDNGFTDTDEPFVWPIVGEKRIYSPLSSPLGNGCARLKLWVSRLLLRSDCASSPDMLDPDIPTM